LERQNAMRGLHETGKALVQRVLHAVYPPQCMTCDTFVEDIGALCPDCWRQTGFIFGQCCDLCGTPLPGDMTADPHAICDDCLTLARPWDQGRAVMVYGDKARQILLGLKYRDRLDHAPVAGKWLARAARPMVQPDMLVAPVPLHWLRLLKRRYNQAAVLSHALADTLQLAHCPDLLSRTRYTGTQDGRSRMDRFANVEGAFRANPRQVHRIAGRHILLVDDVMTAGATFAAASDTLLARGAASVRVIALARVAHAE